MSKSSHNWYCCKTLLNIEGTGAAARSTVDLWQTAKPFLVRWMDEQIGMKALLSNFKREAPQLASLIRCRHATEELMAVGNSDTLASGLLRTDARTKTTELAAGGIAVHYCWYRFCGAEQLRGTETPQQSNRFWQYCRFSDQQPKMAGLLEYSRNCKVNGCHHRH